MIKSVTDVLKRATLILLMLKLGGVAVIAQQNEYVPGEVIIQLNWQKNIERVLVRLNGNLEGKEPVKIKKNLSKRLNIWLLEFDENVININKVLGFSNRIGDVYAAQKNHLVSQRVTVPNDPLYNTMWSMDNTAQTGGTIDADIDAPEAWDIATGGLTALGDTIVVAVIDGGFDLNHEDLNFWKNILEIPGNGVDDDGNGYIDDFDGWDAYDSDGTIPSDAHGTHVSGTIGAIGDNGIGVTGVSWGVQVMPVAGSSGDEATVVEAYGYVYELRATYNETGGDSGAFVVSTNSSFGVNNGDPAQYPIWCGFYDSLGVIGILSCGATMNVNSDVDATGDIPTACPSPYMISVTNTDQDDQRNNGAAYGLTTIDLGAPGTDINSTTPGNNYSDSYTGTSMATPHVAGAIGLLYSVPCASLAGLALASPDMAAMQVRQHIFDGVDVISSLTGITVTDGRLNLHSSVLEVLANCSQSSCSMPYSVGSSVIANSGATMSWSSLSDSLFNVRYKEQGDTVWTTDTTSGMTYNLLGLSTCTAYEFQVESACDTSTSGYTAGFIFTTDGCCIAPSNLAVTGITFTQVTLNWEVILAALSYNVRMKDTADNVWTEYPGVTTNSQITDGLETCTAYEFQVQTVCDTGMSAYSNLFLFTSGCGACIDSTYCPSKGDDASAEWIESVILGSLVNISGNNNGIGDFTTGMSVNLIHDSTYVLTLEPAFSNQTFEEHFKVWIDYNQDGDFDDLEEMIFDHDTATITTVTTNITIPSFAVEGSTRMRVSMKWSTKPDACETSFAYGEVEDYCVSIFSEPPDTTSNGVEARENIGVEILLMPNPAGQSVIVNIKGDSARRISLINVLGKVVWNSSNVIGGAQTALDLSQFSTGMYYVKVETSDQAYTRKLIHY